MFTPLYLEWAPKNSITSYKFTNEIHNINDDTNDKLENKDGENDIENKEETKKVSGCVVFVKNLNHKTSEDTLINVSL